MPNFVNVFITLLLVLIGWVFFYYIDLGAGIEHLGIMFGIISRPLTDAVTIYYFKYYLMFIIAGALASVPWKSFVKKLMGEKKVESMKEGIDNSAIILKPLFATLVFLASLAVLIGQSYNPFLYFRF